MSKLEVTTIEATKVTANTISAGPTVANSTGIYLSGSNSVINTSAIKVNSGALSRTISSVISTPDIIINGLTQTSLITESVNSQIFTANGTWSKPAWANTGNELVIVHMWGGGGGSSSLSYGGGGGAFVFGYFKSSQVNAVCNVVVGIGGTGGVTGGIGETSTFWANSTNSLSAYGGSGGVDSGGIVGRGGGWLSAGNTTVGGAPLGGSTTDSTFGGGGAQSSSIYGGGGGGRTQPAGNSIYGGGGGSNSASAGSSIYGGRGGNNTVTATVPGGGAGGSSNNGANGEVRVYTLRITETFSVN